MSNLTVYEKPGDLLAYLQKSRGAVEMALPKHLNPDRMMRLALTCFSTNPALRKCSAQSILASVVVAAQLGLEPGIAGQAYLIPYGNTCTLVPGWQGLVSLLNNSGRATAWTGSVFEGDEWDFALGSQPRCFHRPGPNFGDPEHLIWVYACGKVNGSEQPVVEAWPMSRVWKHRDKFNKVGARHYSFQHPEMYARKVVLLQVLKYMPRSIELNNAIVAADAVEMGRTTRVEEGIIVDVPAEMPQATLGNKVTPLDAGAAAQKLAKGAEKKQAPPSPNVPAPAPITAGMDMPDLSQEPYVEGGDADPEPTGPSKPELIKQIQSRLVALNMGKSLLNKALVDLEILASGEDYQVSASPETLLCVVERWDEIIERVKNA